jgi:hypothetical protein
LVNESFQASIGALQDIELLSSATSATVAGRDAAQLDFAFTQDGARIHGRLVATTVGGQPVLFVLEAPRPVRRLHSSLHRAGRLSSRQLTPVSGA